MPSLLIASQGPCPATVKSGSSYPMDFAARRAFLTAAGVEMSGLGAPFGTATPTRKFAIGVALPGMMVPEAIAPGKGAMMSDTSRGWPFATVCLAAVPLT